MNIRFALAAPAILALAACGSADDASTEAQADTVEIPANEALQNVEEAPVMDADATVTTEPSDVDVVDETANEAERIEDAGNNAADTAAAAMDEMEVTE